MGQGYTRADTVNNIADGNVVNASDLDAEYDAIEAAFNESTGHDHGGGADNGAPIEVVGPVQDLVITATEVKPKTDNTLDLGTSTLEFKDGFFDGTLKTDTLAVDENATVAGTLGVTGNATLSANLTVNGNTTLGNAATDTVTITADVASNVIPSADSTYSLGDGSNYWSHTYTDAITTTGNAIVGGTLAVTGNSTLTGNLTVNGNTTIGNADTDTVTVTADVASSLIPSADNTYNLGAVGSEWQDLFIDGTANIDSLVADTADINGGSIDGVTLGTNSAVTEAQVDNININGNTISSTDTNGNIAITPNGTGEVDISKVDIDSGTIDGVTIGGASAGAGTFTTITGSGDMNIDSGTLFVDASEGRVGINTTSPATKLQIQADSNSATDQPLSVINSAGSLTASYGAYGLSQNIASDYTINAGRDLIIQSSGSEVMRFDDSGNLLIATSFNGFNARMHMTFSGAGTSNAGISIQNSGGVGKSFIGFINSGGGGIGAISQNSGSTVNYGTSSDYRLKEDVVPMADSITRVKALNPVNFAWKIDGTRVDGFIAHEAQEVVPESVAGEKDAVETVDVYDEDGNVTGQEVRPKYQNIDQSKLVPLLTGALQEAIARIETLEAEVATLKGN